MKARYKTGEELLVKEWNGEEQYAKHFLKDGTICKIIVPLESKYGGVYYFVEGISISGYEVRNIVEEHFLRRRG